jgi:hypothetical protein
VEEKPMTSQEKEAVVLERASEEIGKMGKRIERQRTLIQKVMETVEIVLKGHDESDDPKAVALVSVDELIHRYKAEEFDELLKDLN